MPQASTGQVAPAKRLKKKKYVLGTREKVVKEIIKKKGILPAVRQLMLSTYYSDKSFKEGQGIIIQPNKGTELRRRVWGGVGCVCVCEEKPWWGVCVCVCVCVCEEKPWWCVCVCVCCVCRKALLRK